MLNKPRPRLLKKRAGFSPIYLIAFALIFIVCGGYILLKSFAAGPSPLGDINNDGVVNSSDLSILIADYGTSNGSADLNGDHTVDIIDLSVLLSNFGQTATSNYDSTVLADGPVAFWDMNKQGGSEADLSGPAHAGTYHGSPTLTSLPNGDQAANFNGSSQYLSVPSSADFSIPTTHQLTWEAWIKPSVLQWTASSDPNAYGYVDWMGKCQDYSPTCEWEARMYSTTNPEGRCNRLSAYVFNPSAGLGSAADWQPQCGLLQAGQWLHVVGEYQTLTTPPGCNAAFPGSIDIWVNGVKWSFASHSPTGCMSQYSITPQTKSSSLNIGTMALDSWFPGTIGKVAIYNKLLSQAQINSHFTAMTGAAPSGSCANTCTIPVPTP
jgi:hypothetical protein